METVLLLSLVTLWRVLFYTQGGWPDSSETYYTVTFSSSSGDMPNVLAGIVILSLQFNKHYSNDMNESYRGRYAIYWIIFFCLYGGFWWVLYQNSLSSGDLHTQNIIVASIFLVYIPVIAFVNCKLKSTVDDKHPNADSNRLTYSTWFLSIALILRFFFLSVPDMCDVFGCSSQRNTGGWYWIMMISGITEIFSFMSIVFAIYNMYKLDEQISGPFNGTYLGVANNA